MRVLLLALFAVPLQAQPFLYKQCQGEIMSLAVNQNEVVGSRLPDLRGLNGSAACKDTGRKLRAQWEAEDRAQWEQLSNRACSAKLGWVPIRDAYGNILCTAGGPPPICPRTDHWYRDPTKAIGEWQQDNQTKRLEREAQLAQAVCGCWLSEAKDKADRSAALNSSYVPGEDPGEPGMVVPCAGSCPIPGHDCVGGVCRPQGTYGTLLAEGKRKAAELALDTGKDSAANLPKIVATPENAGELALEMAKGIGEDAVIKSIGVVSESLETAVETAKETPWGAAASLFVATPVGRYSEIYQDQVRKFHASLTEFQSEVSLYYRRRKYADEELLIRAQLLKERADLQERIAEMNEAAQGVTRERDLSKYACYDVFEFQNSLLNTSFARMLGATALAPVVPESGK